MHPYVKLGIMELYVFPLILTAAVFCCMLIYIYSAKYDTFYFPQIKCSSVYCMVGAGVFGKLLYAFTRSRTPDLTIFDRLGGFVFGED